MYSAHFGKSAAHDAPEPKPVSTLPERARQITKPFAGDDALEAWTARLIADADAFQNRKRSDPLDSFTATHKR